jgi:hypothetical protein
MRRGPYDGFMMNLDQRILVSLEGFYSFKQ